MNRVMTRAAVALSTTLVLMAATPAFACGGMSELKFASSDELASIPMHFILAVASLGLMLMILLAVSRVIAELWTA